MINLDDLVSLSWEQKKKYRAAIAYGYFDDYEVNPRTWKHSLVGALLWRYPNRAATLNRLRDIVGHNPQWEDMTDDVIRDFVDETSEVMAMSSAKTICAELKAVLNENRRKVPSDDFMKLLSLKNEASQAVYLTREEIMRVINYKPANDVERFVRRNFLVEFMTGARRCDAERLTINHCDIDTGTLSYVPQKTPGIVVTVPVDERLNLRELLADKYYRDCCDDVFNTIIRRICKACQIDTICTIKRRGVNVTAPKYELVSSHTARRSFATNLYLAGVSLEDIAMLMGHGKNIETTKRYICAERPISKNIMAYFKRQEQ
ncbi:tyrosine-type recombinase/integrase [Prevotella sp. E2-28]|uniref:tyrosine-type recombinase/integrase n=1 Tax=Prevotella sp. E2-28 TaxID=2913620 RepID=UPI001EDC4B1D|nr:tyrosine-type recombinase/integrase [Prevotella sp. E2-28]UKK52706.1 tyrosine-type recombinase/integrase [Prevotella sp. E2-28]